MQDMANGTIENTEALDALRSEIGVGAVRDMRRFGN